MNKLERLAVAQALYKTTGKLVDTKNPESLRFEVDQHFYDQYRETGAKSFDIHIGGEKVGTYSLRFSKPTEQQTTQFFEVQDYEALARWMMKQDTETLQDFASQNLRVFAQFIFDTSGELPDGCNLVEVVTLATESTWQGGVLKVDEGLVFEKLQEQLPPSIAGLLGGAHESE